MPKFSIVIPSRNRASLVGHAVRSALSQTYSDFEIIVSDNCSHDNTEAVVRDIGSDKVQYVRPDSVLAMPDHWQFALGHASGEYVAILCDDDAWCPRLLERVDAYFSSHSTSLVVPGTAFYYGDSWYVEADRNMGCIPAFSGQTITWSSADTLRRITNCANFMEIPRMLNSVVKRDFLLDLQRNYSQVFFNCPDYSFLIMALTLTDSWAYLDEPLRVQGIFSEGIGATQAFNRGQAAEQFLKEFGSRPFFRHVPLQAPVITNYIAETYLTAIETAPSALSSFSINWPLYFVGCWRDICHHERNGVNVRPDKVEFDEVLQKQPPAVQEEVRQRLNGTRRTTPVSMIKGLARKTIDSSMLLSTLELRLRPDRAPLISARHPERQVTGTAAGFSNIGEFATKLGSV